MTFRDTVREGRRRSTTSRWSTTDTSPGSATPALAPVTVARCGWRLSELSVANRAGAGRAVRHWG
jgi:hypothetical protein